MLSRVRAAAQTLRSELVVVTAKTADDIPDALATIRRHSPGAVLLMPDTMLFRERARLVAFANRQRLPLLGWLRAFAEEGALASFGIDSFETSRRAAEHAARILRGTKPADLPVEEPSRVELVVNLRTARALGITVPAALLLRADHVIE
jgi:putative ABC transport system substrate-binding protein